MRLRKKRKEKISHDDKEEGEEFNIGLYMQVYVQNGDLHDNS